MQADLNLRLVHMSKVTFSDVAAHTALQIYSFTNFRFRYLCEATPISFSTSSGGPALFERKLGLILGTKIRFFMANLRLKLGIL